MTPQRKPLDSHAARVQEAHRRLNWLEVEMHRIRAELARLEAAGEDAAAERLEQELLRHERDHEHQQRLADDPDEAASTHTASFDSGATLRIDDAILDKVNSSNARRGRVLSGSAPRKTDPHCVAGASYNPSPAPESDSAIFTIPSRPKTNPKRERRRQKRRTAGRPVWAASLLLHAACLALFGLAGIAAVGPPPLMLQVSAAEGDELHDELAEIDFDPLSPDNPEFDEPEFDNPQAEFDLTEFDSNEFDLADFETPLLETDSEFISPTSFDAPPSEFGLLTAGGGTGGGAGEGRGGRSRGGRRGDTEFFGARSRGDGFVFVVDNSGTMKQGRLETTLIEIQRSVFSMTEDQRFHVLFYSDQAYPMFFPEPVDGLIPATRQNKEKLAAWLQTVEMCVGGRLIDAMELAESMDPDTVYLLSDGEIGFGTMRYMTGDHDWRFVVNTLGMTVKKPEHTQKLLEIANAHRGQYFPVAVNPLAARLARQRPIPYRNSASGPGPVWGSRVPAPR